MAFCFRIYQREKRFQCKRQTFYIDSGKKRAIAPWGANDARELNARKQPITIYSKIDMETMDKGSPRRSIESARVGTEARRNQ